MPISDAFFDVNKVAGLQTPPQENSDPSKKISDLDLVAFADDQRSSAFLRLDIGNQSYPSLLMITVDPRP